MTNQEFSTPSPRLFRLRDEFFTVLKCWDKYHLGKKLEELEEFELSSEMSDYSQEEYQAHTQTTAVIKSRLYNLEAEYRSAIGNLVNEVMEKAEYQEQALEVEGTIQEYFKTDGVNKTLKEMFDNSLNSLRIHRELRLPPKPVKEEKKEEENNLEDS